jgi:hypothetical protein
MSLGKSISRTHLKFANPCCARYRSVARLALVYILAHPIRDAATANWQAFRDDPEWQSVRDKSEANGKLVEKIDSTFMVLTDFSPKLA